MVARFLRRICEFGVYGAASGAALIVDISVLQLLASVLGVHYLIASTVSFVTGGVVLYALSVAFVFKLRRVDNRALEFSFFLALGLVGLIVNSAVIYIAAGAGHLSLLAAKFTAAGFTFSTNFILRRFLLFSRAPQPHAT